jgi:AraC-like DNA-binding protein
VVFVRRGVFEKHVGGDGVVGDPNSVIFFNAGQPYQVTHPQAGGDRCTVLRVRPDVLAELLRPFRPAAADGVAPFPYAHGPCSPRTFLAHRLLVRAIERSDSLDPVETDETVLSLTARAIGEAHGARGERPERVREQTRKARADWAEHTRAVLAIRFRERLMLDDVARQVHCSPYHLSRIFRRHTGTSIHRYLTQLRLRAALDRLADGRPDLTALALDVGFSSHSHFSTAFAREFGTPPSAMRTGN